jgi:undecaprenyl-diphosphatase
MDLLIIFAAKYLIVLPVLVLLFYIFFTPGNTRRRLLWLSVIAMPVAYILARLAGLLYYNARPFVVGHFTPLVAHAADNGFPSDHVLFAATIAMIVLYVNKRAGAFLWIAALLIGIARVLAGVHHVLDIVTSIVIAVIAVVGSQYVISKLRR